jgi:phosphate transport system substrate-binding protein
MKKYLIVTFVMLFLVSGIAFAGSSRDYVSIVGSSTVYPFATVVAEQFGKTTKFKTPKIESTGSGGGLKLFCEGVGVKHPDITNASRAIKQSEIDRCRKNGVKDIVEVKIGYDGIVIANAKSAPRLILSRKDLFLALAKEIPTGKDGELVPNPYKTWKDVNLSLPDYEIKVLGPPPTSGTRDAFVELAMEGGCKEFDWIKALKSEDKSKYKAVCHGIREDGSFIDAGENDILIIKKLEVDEHAFGVFGFSFLDQNYDKIQGSIVDGVEPTFENIASAEYPVSRPLYFYVKKAHIGKIPGIEEYLSEFSSEESWGPDGYLIDKGLIPMPDEERKAFRNNAKNLATLR